MHLQLTLTDDVTTTEAEEESLKTAKQITALSGLEPCRYLQETCPK